MKGLKKIALISAIAAVSAGAQAELKSLDDAVMSDLTGQAGVSIELTTQVKIAEFKYTDEGSFSVSDITIGGASQDQTFVSGVDASGNYVYTTVAGGTNLDDLVINIDINAGGDAEIKLATLTGLPIDFGVSTGAMSLSGTDGTSVLLSSLSMDGLLFQLDIVADNGTAIVGATSDAALTIDAEFIVSDLDADVSFLAVGLEDVRITGNGAHGGAQVGVSMYATTAVGSASALGIQVDDLYLNVDMPIVKIGGTSIGKVALNGVQLNNTVLKVYGH